MWPFTSSSYPVSQIDSLLDKYDYIIVGGGTAGCILANRLSADRSKTVLLVERGPLADSWGSRVPLFSADFASDGSRTLKYTSVHQEQLGRQLELYTGSVLGGGSRINQMFYTRGLPAEYDAWSTAGRKGWSWDELRPYFLKSEDASTYGPIEGVHATGGEWKNRPLDKLYFRCFDEMLNAAMSLELPYMADINSPAHPAFGCGRVFFTIDEQGHRNSTYHAFLPQELALQRQANLHICLDTIVEKLDTEIRPDGTCQVNGVQLVSSGGEMRTIDVAREVVLSAGPIANPKILMLSGIGPAQHLREHGIRVAKDLPAVGANLQDHFAVSVGWNIPMGDSLVSLQARPWLFFWELFRYLLWGTGLLLVPVAQLFIFMHTRLLDSTGKPTKDGPIAEATAIPDIEIMPMAYDTSDQPFPKDKGIFSCLNVLLRPRSKGTIRLTSADPHAPLLIDPRYLSDPADLQPLRAALKLSFRIRDQMRQQGYDLVDWQVPKSESDEDLDVWIRKRNRTTYHYSSTCRMAPEHDEDGGGVVDDELRVYGVGKLRVADSSIFPWVPATHLQAPTVAVAEKCADMIKGTV